VSVRELVLRAREGDEAAFEAIARAAAPRLTGVAVRILRDPAAADDAVQEALVRAWRDVHGLRDPDRLDAWLHRLIVHAALDELRRRRSRPIEVAVLPLDVDGRPDLAGQLDEREALDRAFRRLSGDHPAVLVLRHYLGLRTAEIATTLRVPSGTVESRLHYAARALRAALEADTRLPILEGAIR
jgi:RNA polymerase sigma-70 factor, ECF subfamily